MTTGEKLLEIPIDLIRECLSFLTDDDSEYAVLRQLSKIFEIEPRVFCADYTRFLSRVERLEWAFSNRYICDTMTFFYVAGEFGNIEVLKWLRQNDYQWDRWTSVAAARAGNFEILKWIMENGCPWGWTTYAAAAGIGRIDILRWLRYKGCPSNGGEFTNAARSGRLETLKWMHENPLANSVKWSEEACIVAAQENHIEVLRWLRQHGCPWNKWVCTVAASRGHLEILKWAVAHGCRWDKEKCRSIASQNSHTHIVAWIAHQ